MNSILNHVDQKISDIVYHSSNLNSRLESSLHLEDQTEQEICIHTGIHVIQIERHSDYIRNSLLPRKQPSGWKDQLRRLTSGYRFSLTLFEEIMDNEIGPRVNLV